MGTFGVKNLVSYLVILMMLPAVTFAVTQPVCRCGPPTPESYKWNFSKEAAELLNQIHTEAYQSKDAAARLASYDRGERNLIDWRVDASLLSQEKDWANDMDRKLCRLRIIERVLPADQQAEIKALTPAVIEVTDNTELAIQFLNDHHDELGLPHYAALAGELYNESSRAETASINANQHVEANYTSKQTTAPQNLKSGA
jgi:hypothetical protein